MYQTIKHFLIEILIQEMSPRVTHVIVQQGSREIYWKMELTIYSTWLHRIIKGKGLLIYLLISISYYFRYQHVGTTINKSKHAFYWIIQWAKKPFLMRKYSTHNVVPFDKSIMISNIPYNLNIVSGFSKIERQWVDRDVYLFVVKLYMTWRFFYFFYKIYSIFAFHSAVRGFP